MRTRWHIAAILLALVAGAVALFWPVTSENPHQLAPGMLEEPPAGSGGVVEPRRPVGASPSSTGASASELTQRAINARAVGDIETAVALFEQAIAVDPTDTVALSNYGRLLTLAFSLERAIDVLEASRDLQPDNAQAWLDLATVYERAQLFRKSRDAQAKAQALVGADAITRDELGRFVVSGTTLE